MEEKPEVIKNECQELKNIKYKTMLLNGAPIVETKSSNDMTNLDKFLETEKNNNNNEPWCKLNKTVKIKKLTEFVDAYSQENKLSVDESKSLIAFLKDCLDKKKLARVKDVNYDKETGIVKEIPALVYTKSNKHFTLKNIDKRVSTLKSLAPKRGQGTIKNKVSVSVDSDADDDDDNDKKE
jgi:hypothetical protein